MAWYSHLFKNFPQFVVIYTVNIKAPSYNYTVKVTNRFKGLDLIEYLKNYGWRFVTLYMRQ